MLGDLARSKFEKVRAQFARSLSIDNATPDIVRALEGMIITGTETIPLASAILALMELHGFPYDPFDPDHRTLYQAQHSDKPENKLAGMNRLNAFRPLAGS